MDGSKYDDIFFDILKEEGQLFPFLNAVFGFLYRRTDFYCIQEDPKGKIGFPEGVAETIVRNVYRKWEDTAHPPKPPPNEESDELPDLSQLVVKEVEVETTPFVEKTPKPVLSTVKRDEPNSDTYNGADYGSYRWSQTIQDVDIHIPVGQNIVKATDVRVDVQSDKLVVHIRDEDSSWRCLVEGKFMYKNKKDDSMWSLVSGNHILVHLEKCEERWWRSLLTTEPKLDSSRINSARPITDLTPEEQMKIEEVMHNEKRKYRGLSTLKQMEMESILKKAWNIEGSPFEGTPYDPSVIVDFQI